MEKSAERIVILDFRTGKVFIEYVPMDLIEDDAEEVVIRLEDKLGIRESDCQYMVVNDDNFMVDNTELESSDSLSPEGRSSQE